MMFAAALIALPAVSNAAPRTIDDCEKILAADAYNQCLAVFGPVAHSHALAHDSGGKLKSAEDQSDIAPTTGRAAAAAPHHGRYAHAHSRHASRHGWTKNGSAGHHSHARRSGAAQQHAGVKRLQFSVVSGHTKVR
jgi:hypothetical protein